MRHILLLSFLGLFLAGCSNADWCHQQVPVSAHSLQGEG